MEQLLKSRRYTVWELVKLYWQSDQRRYAYLFSAAVIMMTIILVVFDVIFSYWYNYFYDALQQYNMKTTVHLLVIFFILAGIYIIFAVYRYYMSQLFGLRWRKWLTDQFLNRWLEKRDYYYLENFDERTDNPDQRIQEDVGSLVTSTISLSINFISSLTTFIGFIYVLWKLSGDIQIPLGSSAVLHIHGYLVIVALVYALIGTYFTFRIGHPLVTLNFEQQRREANFRFAAIDLRIHAENIALYNGEEHEKGILGRLFGGVLDNWYNIIVRQKILLWFTSGYNQVAVVLPLFVALPNYFSKKFLLGDVMQVLRSFGSIQDAASFFVNSYTSIAELRAIAQRLITFLDHMEEIDAKVLQHKQLVLQRVKEDKIAAKALSIETPRGEKLLENINEEFIHGKNYLIKGVSGIGKSTFMRVVAGIWPFAQGVVDIPKDKKIMYLPQKPYMPIGTLIEAILFPEQHQPERDADVEAVLKDCNLENLIPRLHETASWSQQLSPGEQQRINFARLLLHKPDWAFMDESTSMLDVGNEERLYQLVKTKLPNCSIVSVGHRPTLDILHDQVVDMAIYTSRF